MAERDLTKLTNDDGVRVAVRRLFSGHVGQIVGELLQNAQRAGAGRIEFETSIDEQNGVTKCEVRVRDDGTGVLDGINGWHTMLSIADSSYQDENVELQHPLGIGLHALFASAKVSKVTLRSQGRWIEIETEKWWDQPAYFSTWMERLILDERENPERGLELRIECTKAFVSEVIEALTGQETQYWFSSKLPARGYEGVLEVTLDGEAVNTKVLSRFLHSESMLLWEGEYLGNRLKIAHGPRSCVNWYGQPVEDHLLSGGFSYYLEVRSGTPLDLKSPTREGIIENEKREALKQFIIDRIFEVVNGCSFEEVRLDWVRWLTHLDWDRAMNEARYYVAGRINNAAEAAFSSHEDFVEIKEEVKEYGREEVLLLERFITVEDHDGHEIRDCADWHGIESFVENLRRVYGQPYELVAGNMKRLRVRELVWRPQNLIGSIFVDHGVFTLREKDEEPLEWHAVTGDVFAFEYTSAYNLDVDNLLVATGDRYGWLMSNDPWALFDSEGADDSYETCRDLFEKSILDVTMTEFPDTIAEPFSLSDLSGRLGGGCVMKIEVTRPENGPPLLRITDEKGTEKELKVI